MSNGTTAIGIIEQWIFQQLSGDSALVALLATAPRGGPAIYAYEADEGATYPLVTFAPQAPAKDTRGPGGTRYMSQPQYMVTVYGQRVGIAALDPIAKRVDAALNTRSGQLPGGPILFGSRLNMMAFGDSHEGVPYRRIVQTYLFQLQEGYPP